MTHPDIVKNSSIGGRTCCVRTETGQGAAFTMDVDRKRYLVGIVACVQRFGSGRLRWSNISGLCR